jgi:hypothetical protein
MSQSICVVHCQVDREEPHSNARDIQSLLLFSQFGDVTFVNAFGPGIAEVEDRRFDLVVVTNSFMVMRSSPYWKFLLRRIRKLLTNASQRILFVQDDYHRIDRTVSLARSFDIQICSVFSGEDEIYTGLGVRTYPWLIGFADEEMDQMLSHLRVDWNQRSIDVGQRVYFLGLEFGSDGRRKAELAVLYSELMTRYGLTCDVSTDEESRFSGMDWFKFLGNCRSTIGRHSGASLVTKSSFDPARALAIQETFNDENFEQQLSRYLGKRRKERSFLAPSPRMFEAASLHVLQVLERSHISYGLEEWNHFVPISPDLSESEQVAKFIKSQDAAEMTLRCHRELFENPKWRREIWINDLAHSLGFSSLENSGVVNAPSIELDLYERVRGGATRQERQKEVSAHSKLNRNGQWHPIESIFRWKPVGVAQL